HLGLFCSANHSIEPGCGTAARMQRTITPEYMCQGCDCRRTLMVMRSLPACSSRSSSLPKALTENGQVGSRNTSKMRGPWPQTSGSARHTFMRSFLYPVEFAESPKRSGRRAPEAFPGYDKIPGARPAERQSDAILA